MMTEDELRLILERLEATYLVPSGAYGDEGEECAECGASATYKLNERSYGYYEVEHHHGGCEFVAAKAILERELTEDEV